MYGKSLQYTGETFVNSRKKLIVKLDNVFIKHSSFIDSIVKQELYNLLKKSNTGMSIDEIHSTLTHSSCPTLKMKDIKEIVFHCDFAYKAGNLWKFFNKYPEDKMHLSKILEKDYKSDNNGQLVFF